MNSTQQSMSKIFDSNAKLWEKLQFPWISKLFMTAIEYSFVMLRIQHVWLEQIENEWSKTLPSSTQTFLCKGKQLVSICLVQLWPFNGSWKQWKLSAIQCCNSDAAP